jgi:hypothetical protein
MHKGLAGARPQAGKPHTCGGPQAPPATPPAWTYTYRHRTPHRCRAPRRQITQAAAQGFVFDYETISRFMLTQPSSGVDGGGGSGGGARVRVLQRVAAFLQPQVELLRPFFIG